MSKTLYCMEYKEKGYHVIHVNDNLEEATEIAKEKKAELKSITFVEGELRELTIKSFGDDYENKR